MDASISKYPRIFMLLIAIAYFPAAFGSHIVGGGFTYQYLGDTIISGGTFQKYRVTLELYQDCVTGVPEAIEQDNPAFFTVYETGKTAYFQVDTNIFYNATPGSGGSITIPSGDVSSPCGYVSLNNLTALCLMRKKFVKDYLLPENSTGYVVAYQRCCRNSSIVNVTNPGDNGITFFCNIPPATTLKNTSAVFTYFPPQAICNNISMVFDHAATDADGDSLSYELCGAYNGATDADIKPMIASPPPYDEVAYYPPYTHSGPMSATVALQVDPATGKLSVTPGKVGRYLIGVLCNEWRGGVIINTTRREFQWVVTDCSNFVNNFNPDAGPDRIVMVGASVQFGVTGADRYMWIPGDFLSNPYTSDPVGVFTETGEFTYTVYSETTTGCNGKDTVKITVLDHADFAVPTAFTPNGDGRNDVLTPVPVGNSTLKSFRVFNRWGNLISNITIPGSGWDGTLKGTRQDPGVYSWSVEYVDNTGVTRIKSGNTALLR